MASQITNTFLICSDKSSNLVEAIIFFPPIPIHIQDLILQYLFSSPHTNEICISTLK